MTTISEINDFGFTEGGAELPQDPRMQKLESLIMPLLKRLSSSTDDIHWPNRKEPLEKLMKDILEVTRS